MEAVLIQYLWQWVVQEPSSPHFGGNVDHFGLKEILGQEKNSMELPTETVHL